MKRGLSVTITLLLCALALAARLLWPIPAKQLREVFFPAAAYDRVQEVFSPHD